MRNITCAKNTDLHRIHPFRFFVLFYHGTGVKSMGGRQNTRRENSAGVFNLINSNVFRINKIAEHAIRSKFRSKFMGNMTACTNEEITSVLNPSKNTAILGRRNIHSIRRRSIQGIHERDRFYFRSRLLFLSPHKIVLRAGRITGYAYRNIICFNGRFGFYDDWKDFWYR